MWTGNVLGCRASVTGQATLRGLPVTVDLDLVADEVERRQRAGLGALLQRADLHVLSGLPVDLPVPVGMLSGPRVEVLNRMKYGAVDVTDQVVTRRAVAPVRIRSVTYETRRWSQGLTRVSRFAPFAARAILLPEQPRDIAALRTAAAYYGIGVSIGTRDEPTWLVKPAPFRPLRYTPASWLFAETVFAVVDGAV